MWSKQLGLKEKVPKISQRGLWEEEGVPLRSCLETTNGSSLWLQSFLEDSMKLPVVPGGQSKRMQSGLQKKDLSD